MLDINASSGFLMSPFFFSLVLLGIFEVIVIALSFKAIDQITEVNLLRLWTEKWRADMIVSSLSDGVFLLNGETILYLNPVAEKILSVSPVDALKTVWRSVQQTLPIEFTLDEDGKKSYFLIRSCSVSGDETHVLVLAQDVTFIKESQEAKCHFLASVAHDVKTPMTSLTMATRLLRNKVDEIQGVSHRNLIMTCSESVDRLRILLEELLIVSRVDILDQRLEIQKIDLGKLVRHLVQSFSKRAEERGIHFRHKIVLSGKSMLVPIDASKVSWVLSNLIINSLIETSRGGEITVFVESFDDFVKVSVIDSGSGSTQKIRELAFAGLPIAKEIVVAHGGTIWVESEPSHGAKFSFILPSVQADLVKGGMVREKATRMAEQMNAKNCFFL